MTSYSVEILADMSIPDHSKTSYGIETVEHLTYALLPLGASRKAFVTMINNDKQSRLLDRKHLLEYSSSEYYNYVKLG